MHEKEKMQAHFSKNNNFGGTLRTERNIYASAFLFFFLVLSVSHNISTWKVITWKLIAQARSASCTYSGLLVANTTNNSTAFTMN